MTVATEAIDQSSAVVDAVRAIEPRIDSVNAKWRDIIASMVLAEIPFDVAVAKFSSVINDVEKAAAEQKVTQQKMREMTREQFSAAISGFLKTEALKIEEKSRPIVWRILVDHDSPAKNADGSPAMDAENNPVRETAVEISGTYTRKNPTESTGESTGQRGRLGGYLKIEGRNENFGSLKEVATAIGVDGATNARTNIVAAGWTISDALSDSDGKKYFTVTKTPVAAANGAAQS